MRVAIIGSRSITDRDKVNQIIFKFLSQANVPIPVILSGGAVGVDSLALDYAKEHGYDYILFEPYHLLDRRAEFKPDFFFARNRQIVKNADCVLAIWDTKSKGTEHTIKYAQSLNKPVTVIKVI